MDEQERKDRKREQQKAWRAKNPDYHKTYKRKRYERDPDKVLAENKRWRERNRPALSAKRREILPHRREVHERWRDNNREHVRTKHREYVTKNRSAVKNANWKWRLKTHYGLTLEQHEQMSQDQMGLCAICGKVPDRGLVVDHDHGHGVDGVRALLCHNCNRSIGLLHDDPQIVEVALAYLKHWKQQHGK